MQASAFVFYVSKSTACYHGDLNGNFVEKAN